MCIYVREISNDEHARLKSILRQSKDGVKVKRTQIVLASSQRMKVPEISRILRFHRKYIEQIIHRSNDIGFEALESSYKNCGKKPTFDEVERRKIVEIALSRPTDLGLPFTEWSLPKLKSFITSQTHIESISIETIRRILNEQGIKYRHTKTWKQSNDPNFELKKSNFISLR